MRRLSHTPSVVPGQHATVYLVLDDFGSVGQAYREIDPNDSDERAVIDDLITGQFENPVKIITFNLAEGWCRDVSEDIARRAISTARRSKRQLSKVASEFYTRQTGEAAPRELIDA